MDLLRALLGLVLLGCRKPSCKVTCGLNGCGTGDQIAVHTCCALDLQLPLAVCLVHRRTSSLAGSVRNRIPRLGPPDRGRVGRLGYLVYLAVDLQVQLGRIQDIPGCAIRVTCRSRMGTVRVDVQVVLEHHEPAPPVVPLQVGGAVGRLVEVTDHEDCTPALAGGVVTRTAGN